MRAAVNNFTLLKLLVSLASCPLLGACGDGDDSSADNGWGKDGVGKDCEDGEVFEYGGETYECVDGQWPESDKKGSECELSAAGGELSSETLSHDGETRDYLLYLPETYDGTTDHPLMLNFHGFGGTSEDHMCSADMRALADRENFILVYPQGTLLDGVSHWNYAEPSADNKSDADDLGFVDALLDELSANHSVDEKRVYASGYSNGGFMAYGLACQLSGKIAAVGAVSGTMQAMENCSPSHPVPIIALHGTADGVVPYDGGNGFSSVADTLAFWVIENSTSETPVVERADVDGTTIEHHSYLDSNGDSPVQHYKIVDGDHVWFDIEYDGASTSALIWNFVSQWDIDGARSN